MKKKAFALILTASMIAGLAACGNSGSSNSASSSTKSDAKTEESKTEGSESTAASIDPNDPWAGWSDIDTSEHVKITYMTTGDKPSGEAAENLQAMMDQLNAVLTEKVNAELDIYYIGWTDCLSNYNLTLAQMDGTVDLVGSSSDWLDAWPNTKNGAFLELSEDMLAKYAPATYASVSPEHWDLCRYNGNISFIPEDNYAQWTNHGWIYRMDWAKEAGLSNGVHSWEDLTEYFKYVKQAYPDVIPWDADGTAYPVGGWLQSHTDYVSIDGLSTGAMWGGTKEDLYTVYCPYMTETDLLVEYAKLMKEWDEIGVWKTDVLNNTTATNRDDYRVGKVAVEQHHTQTWTDLVSHTASNTIYDTDPDEETGFFWFGEEQKNLVAMSITHGVMAVSAASENPERALMVYDLLRNDPECYKLLCYGIEGVSYEVNSEGLRTIPEGYNPDTQNINGMTNYWWGRNDDIEIKDATRNWDAIDALYAEYDKVKIDYPYGQFVPDVDDIGAKISNCQEVYNNYMKQICYGKYNGTAEDFVAEFQAALQKAGVDDVTAELQRQFDALYK